MSTITAPSAATTTTAIRHRVGVHAPMDRVHAAIATTEGVAGWWSRFTTGDATEGGTLRLSFNAPTGSDAVVDGTFGVDDRTMALEVVSVAPDRIEWRVVEGPQEWLVTPIVFELSQEGDETVILFSQADWAEPVAFQAHCSAKWAVYLLSLKALVERGEGRAFPNDVHVSAWD